MMNKPLQTLLSLSLLFPPFAVAKAEETIVSDADSRTNLRITIYTGGFAAVSETRPLSLATGAFRIAFRGVPAAIEPDTVWLEGDGFVELERSFDAGLLTPQSLIEKALGQTIVVERTNPATGRKDTREARVLSVTDGVVLQYDDGIEIFGQGGLPERFSFKQAPEGLSATPVLSALVDTAEPFEGEVRLNYLSGGFTWKADYVASLSPDEASLDIQAWITLSNHSGANFENARVQVVAGEVNRARYEALRRDQAMMVKAAKAADAPRQQLGDYHVYSLAQPTTLRDKQTKQAALFAVSGVSVEKVYVFDARGQTEAFLPVKIYYEFDNTEANHLGRPFPAGIFRIYAHNGEGDATFIGESAIPGTPEGERVILQPGQAFDVTVSEKQTSYQREEIPDQYPSRTRYRETVGKEVTVRNAKDEAVTVRFFEHFGANWEILDESRKHVREDARTIYWEVKVPAKGEATLTYTRRTW